MNSFFKTTWENPKIHIWCKLGDYSSNELQVIPQARHISKNSESKWPKWPWRSRTVSPIFNTSQEYHRMYVWCKFGELAQIFDELMRGQTEFHRILSQKGQKDRRSRSMTSIFITSQEYPRMHVWSKCGDSSSNPWRVIVGTRWSLRTDGQTDGRTDRRR